MSNERLNTPIYPVENTIKATNGASLVFDLSENNTTSYRLTFPPQIGKGLLSCDEGGNLDWSNVYREKSDDLVIEVKDSIAAVFSGEGLYGQFSDSIRTTAGNIVFRSDSPNWNTPTIVYSEELNTILLSGNIRLSLDGGETIKDTPFTDKDGRGAAWSPELGLFVVFIQDPTIPLKNILTFDGSTWTEHFLPSSKVFYSIQWCPGFSKFIAVNSVFSTTPGFMESADGKLWTNVANMPTTTSATEWRVSAYSAELNVFIAASNSNAQQLLRYDGSAWSFPTITAEEINDIAWSAALSLFVVCGVNTATQTGFIATSPTGEIWTTRTSPLRAEHQFITTIDEYGSIVISGIYINNVKLRTFIYSTDGAVWQQLNIQDAPTYGIRNFIYVKKYKTLVGQSDNPTKDIIILRPIQNQINSVALRGDISGAITDTLHDFKSAPLDEFKTWFKFDLADNLTYETFTQAQGGALIRASAARNIIGKNTARAVCLNISNNLGSTTQHAGYFLPTGTLTYATITVSMWIYPRDSFAPVQTLFTSFENGVIPGRRFKAELRNSTISLYIGSNTVPVLVSAVGYQIPFDDWTMITISVSSSVKIYINGKLSATVVNTFPSLTGMSLILPRLGIESGSFNLTTFSNPFTGYISDFIVYDQEIDPTETDGLYDILKRKRGFSNINNMTLSAPGGSSFAPSIGFYSDEDTGLYSDMNNTLSITCGGTDIADFTPDNIYFKKTLTNIAQPLLIRSATVSTSVANSQNIKLEFDNTVIDRAGINYSSGDFGFNMGGVYIITVSASWDDFVGVCELWIEVEPGADVFSRTSCANTSVRFCQTASAVVNVSTITTFCVRVRQNSGSTQTCGFENSIPSIISVSKLS